MNKKLFSWKALAGLALLVAMGLTSCKQGTEVDPTDPYNTNKTTKPGVVTGNADLNINVAIPTDVKAQFDSWWAGLKDADKKKYNDASEFTIFVKSGVKLDGNTVSIPKPAGWTTTTGKIVNIIFNGAFTDADKNALKINTDAISGGLVNVTLPGGTFNVDLASTLAQISLTSAAGATLGTLNANVAAGKNGLSLKDGIVVNGYSKIAGDVSLNGGSIVALVADAGTVKNDAGDKAVKISDGVYVKSIIATGDITVDACGFSSPLDKITIAEGKTVTLTNTTAKGDWTGNGQPYVAEIVGLGNTGATVKLSGANVTADALKNITAVSNVNLDAAALDLKVSNDIFSNVTLTTTGTIALSAKSLANVSLPSKAEIKVSETGVTYAFENVKFAKNVLKMTPSATKAIGTSKTQWFQWDATLSAWVEIADASKVSAANKALQADELNITATDKIKMNAVTPATDPETFTPSSDLAKQLGGKYWFSLTTTYTVDVAASDYKTIVSFDTKSTVGGKALEPGNLQDIFVTTSIDTWFQPMFGGVQLKWFKSGTDWIAGAAD